MNAVTSLSDDVKSSPMKFACDISFLVFSSCTLLLFSKVFCHLYVRLCSCIMHLSGVKFKLF